MACADCETRDCDELARGSLTGKRIATREATFRRRLPILRGQGHHGRQITLTDRDSYITEADLRKDRRSASREAATVVASRLSARIG